MNDLDHANAAGHVESVCEDAPALPFGAYCDGCAVDLPPLNAYDAPYCRACLREDAAAEARAEAAYYADMAARYRAAQAAEVYPYLY